MLRRTYLDDPPKKQLATANGTVGAAPLQAEETRKNEQDGAQVTDWEQIVKTHGPDIYRLARRITGRDGDAEDVVQDVFLETYQFQKHETVRDWRGLLLSKTTHRALDRIRRRKPTVTIDKVELASRTHGPMEAAIANEVAVQLRQAIANLTDQQAAAFCLRYFDGCSNTEIAASLQTTAGAIATALHHARTKLASMLAEVTTGESE